MASTNEGSAELMQLYHNAGQWDKAPVLDNAAKWIADSIRELSCRQDKLIATNLNETLLYSSHQSSGAVAEDCFHRPVEDVAIIAHLCMNHSMDMRKFMAGIAQGIPFQGERK